MPVRDRVVAFVVDLPRRRRLVYAVAALALVTGIARWCQPACLDLSESFVIAFDISGGEPPFEDSVFIRSDGSIERTVFDLAGRTPGPHKTTSTLSPDELSRLRAMFESARFARLDDVYGHEAADSVTWSLAIDTPSGRRRIVFIRDSFDARPPDALAEAIDLILSLPKSH